MWNKGLSYRERHGLIEKDTNTKLNDDVNSTIDKAKYHHSLGLVFFPAFDWKFLKHILNDKSVYSIRVIKL